MFYSHEVLTSRKYGVATVWLVATLGSKSNLKKINRKAILDVNIPKACQTVSDPEAPMALRLQSSLLYGISRVYFQQCTYILVDAQAAQSNMRALLRVIKTAELDPDAGKARPDQLVLQDDPAFVPDNIYPMMDLDFSMLESSQASEHPTALLSDPSRLSSRSSVDSQNLPGIEIPASGSSGANFGGFELAGPMPGPAEQERRITLDTGEGGFLPDVGFDFDEEGNVFDLGAPDVALPEIAVPPRLRRESQLIERVRMEHEEGFMTGRQPLAEDMELDQPLLQDDQQELPPAEPFPERQEPQEASPQASEELSSEFVDVQQTRKPRTARALPVDHTLQIRNSELQRWNDDYTTTMATARRQKAANKVQTQSKKNAAHFVFAPGIGGIGTGITPSGPPHPLASLFSGPALLQTLLGLAARIPAPPTHKRPRSHSPSSSDTDLSTRRKRLRTAEGDPGSHFRHAQDDQEDQLGQPPTFDPDASIEVARQALPLLSDPYSSQMPWNISSRAGSHASARPSRQGSVASATRPGSIGGGFGFPPPVVGGPGSATSFDRRASRVLSASPVVGARRSSRAAEPVAVGRWSSSPGDGGEGDTGMLLGEPTSGAEEGGEGGEESALRGFQVFGPKGEEGELGVGESQSSGAMDRESGNFLVFVREAVEEKRRDLGAGVGPGAETESVAGPEAGVGVAEGEGEDVGGEQERSKDTGREKVEIAFEELLPPENYTKVVAAQAFLHVLALVNKGLLSAVQEVGREEGQWWKPVMLGVVEGVA